MHPKTSALLEAISRVLDVPPKRFDLAADKAADDAIAAWGAAGRPDLKPLVGGPPPVPGVGWGVTRDASPMVYPLTAVCAVRDGWWGWADVDGERKSADSHDVTALYRLGDPADQPYWRRE